MAENNKGGIFNKAGKLLSRKKTKVLQTLRKQGRTTDEVLVEDCHKLEKQLEVGNKFHKDLRLYVHSAKALSVASKTFYTTVADTYEEAWENHNQITEILKNMEMLWQDYLQKLQEQVHEPLTKYLATIPHIKARIAKRGRKLIDYDNAKHNVDVHQNAKKKDDAKLAKAQEDLDQAQKIYDELNNELHNELPEFHNSRVRFYGNLFQSLFSAENVFQSEAGKGSEQINSSAEKLSCDHEHATYSPRKSVRHTVIIGDGELTNGHAENGPESPLPDSPSSSSTSPTSPLSVSTTEPLTNGTADADTSKDSEGSYENTALPKSKTEQVVKTDEVTVEPIPTTAATDDAEVKTESAVGDETPAESAKDEIAVVDEKQPEQAADVNGDLNPSTDQERSEPEVPDDAPPPVPASMPPGDEAVTHVVEADVSAVQDETKAAGEDDCLYQAPPPARPVDDDLPENFLYTVVATHLYKGEDDDELSFQSNDVIYVQMYDDPEEQKKMLEKKSTDKDVGWLMGTRKEDGKKGVFPENFTRKV